MSTTAITPHANGAALAERPPEGLAERYGLSEAQLDLVRTQVAPGAPDDVLELYFVRCRQLGFDPLSKMLFAIPRGGWKKDAAGNLVVINGKRVWDNRAGWTFQTSIDGFRSIGESSAGYAGQDGPYWCGEDGVWTDVWLKKEAPRAAKVGIRRQGFEAPLYAVATLEEYAQRDKDGGLTGLWPKMPATMLAKCAEALAWRKTFPQRLAGVYTRDEMLQAENEAPEPPAVAGGKKPAPKAVKAAGVEEPLPALGPAPDPAPAAAAAQALEPPTEAELAERYKLIADPRTLKKWLKKIGVDLDKKQPVNGRYVLSREERQKFDNALRAFEIEVHGQQSAPPAEPVQDAQFVEEAPTVAQVIAAAQPPDAGTPIQDDGLDAPCGACGAPAGVPCEPTCQGEDDEPAPAVEYADPPEGFDAAQFPEGSSTRTQRAQIGILCEDMGISAERRHKMIYQRFTPKWSATHLDKAQASAFISELKSYAQAAASV